MNVSRRTTEAHFGVPEPRGTIGFVQGRVHFDQVEAAGGCGFGFGPGEVGG